ncbi:basic proline-rich protein-like [Acinonyx jubatus]|uniref:Basic proline-rich protein-like n=1 Tax=Acinonyx jubatus TaxID=32536 RepID=A0A6J1ZK47_ACIJB|nr:basic proline-rich protein-like [Acinonyx jubatus]
MQIFVSKYCSLLKKHQGSPAIGEKAVSTGTDAGYETVGATNQRDGGNMSSLQNPGMTEDTKYSSEQLLLRNNFQSDQPLGSGCYQRNPASSVGHVVSSAWKDLFPLRALPSGWGTPTQPKRLRFQPPSPPTTPALGPNPASKSSSKRPSSWPQPLPPPRWPPHPPPGFAAAVREALGTSQNREQLPTSGCRPPRGSGRTGCGRRGRDYALAFRLPQRAGKLRPRAGGNFSRVHSPGPQASRPPSAIPRPHAPPGRPGEPGEERVSERALRPGPRRAPDAANSPRKVVVSQPALASHLRDTPSRGPWQPHSHIRSTLRTPLSTLSHGPSPSHACSGRPLPRAPSCTPTRGRGAPSPPGRTPGLRAAPARASGAREPQPRAATRFRPPGGRQKPGHTRGALPPPAAAPPPATALRGREREAERALCPRAAARPGTLPRGGSRAESPPPPLPPGGPGRPRWGEPG